VSRRVPPLDRRPRRFADRGLERIAALGGALVLAGYLEVLFLRARLAEPSRWDTWAFWMPKAMSIVYFDGLDTRAGGFTSFANPDYPPLKPAIDAAAFRFLGDVDPGALAVQNWIVAAAFFGGVAALLAPRVRPAVLWPSLALLALLPDFGLLVASLLADESLALLFALAGVCGALWLVEKEVRFAVLAAFFLATAALVKNEGLMLALVLFVLLAMNANGLPRRHSSGVVRRSRRMPSARSFSAFLASRPSTGRVRIHSSGTSTLRPTASFHRSPVFGAALFPLLVSEALETGRADPLP
jgi:hypothetical protein